MDVLHKALKWVDHDRYKAFGILLAIILVFYSGCAVKTASLKNPTVEVTAPVYAQEAAELRAQLEGESLDLQAKVKAHNEKIEAFNEREDIGYEDLKAKQARKEESINIISTAALSCAEAAGIPVPESASKWLLGFISVAGTGGTVLSVLDGRRKDKKIAADKAKASDTAGKTVQT